MARDWRDIFIIDGELPAAEEAAPEQRVGRFRRLRESLRKTRQALQTEIQATLFEDLSEETWERLEEARDEGLVILDSKEIRVTSLGRIFIRNVAMAFDRYLREQQMDHRPLFSKTL